MITVDAKLLLDQPAPEWAKDVMRQQHAEIERLCALVKTLADDLEDELKGHYAGVIEHPAMKARFERDMVNVYAARRALEE